MSWRLSKEAGQDLDGIFAYWGERAGLAAADRLIDHIVRRFWLIGEHPEAGRAADDLAPGVRCFPAGKYLIYYRRAGRVSEILHVFHGARRQPAAFRRSRRGATGHR
jgi:toxin ParE1/3/4